MIGQIQSYENHINKICHVGSKWGFLGSKLGGLVATLAPSWAVGGDVGRKLEGLGAILIPSWGVLGSRLVCALHARPWRAMPWIIEAPPAGTGVRHRARQGLPQGRTTG